MKNKVHFTQIAQYITLAITTILLLISSQIFILDGRTPIGLMYMGFAAIQGVGLIFEITKQTEKMKK